MTHPDDERPTQAEIAAECAAIRAENLAEKRAKGMNYKQKREPSVKVYKRPRRRNR